MAKGNNGNSNDGAPKKKKIKTAKKSIPFTPIERMEDMALTSRVTEALSPHLNGLTDKTLTEFIVHLAETQLKKGDAGADAWREGQTLGTQQMLEESQKLKQRMAENGAPELPLSLCKNLLEWVHGQSPRIRRWAKKAARKRRQAA